MKKIFKKGIEPSERYKSIMEILEPLNAKMNIAIGKAEATVIELIFFMDNYFREFPDMLKKHKEFMPNITEDFLKTSVYENTLLELLAKMEFLNNNIYSYSDNFHELGSELNNDYSQHAGIFAPKSTSIEKGRITDIVIANAKHFVKALEGNTITFMAFFNVLRSRFPEEYKKFGSGKLPVEKPN